MMAKIKLYKIRHKRTGEYRMAGGGIPGRWNKLGKAWPNIGHLKNHLNMLRYNTSEPLPSEVKNWEIVVVEVDTRECETIEIEDLWK